MDPEFLAELIAQALCKAEWSEKVIKRHLRATIGAYRQHSHWLRPFLARFLNPEERGPLSRDHAEILRYVWADPSFAGKYGSGVYVSYELDVDKLAPVGMSPASVAKDWDVPAITNSRALANWLALSVQHLDWLADCRGLERWASREPLRNYRYRWITKHTGGRRLVESPKPRLKSVQRQILDGIVADIPVHKAAHAFRSQRSVATFAKPHIDKDVVLRIDLRDFFPSIQASRVHGIFRTAGYPRTVCQLLTGLCTNRTWNGATDAPAFCVPHLPQGAPTSPALSNLCAWHLDCRLTGLAKKFGAKYTRYADDLVFSGDRVFAKQLSRFRVFVYAIAIAEGFSIRNRKTRVMTQSQRQSLGGVLVNQRLGISRAEFDRLKAILTNCVRHGPKSQNRDSHPNFREHLRGRVAWVASVNKRQGARLISLFEKIVWH